MKIVIVSLFISLFSATTLFSQGITGRQLLLKLDASQTLDFDLTAKISMIQQKVGQNPKKIESLYYRRDADDNFLIVMLEPNVEKGNGYLKNKDNFWMYRQNTRSFQHINRDENVGSTDMRGGDFEKRKISELYKTVIENGKEKISEEKLGQIDVYKIEIVAQVVDVTFTKQTYWIEKGTFLTRKIQSFSEAGTLMQSQYFPQYSLIQGHYFVVKGLTVDEFEKGNKTTFQIGEVSFAPIESKIFTKAYLESLSQ